MERLSTLAASGMNLSDGMRIASGAPGPGREILARTNRLVERGISLSRALERSGAALDPSDIALVRAGERSGDLGAALDSLAKGLIARHEARRKIFAATIYPAALLATAFGLAAFLSVVALPSFARIYADGGRRLPPATRYAMAVGDFVRVWGPATIVAVAAAIGGLQISRARWPALSRIFDAFVWRLPATGRLVRDRCRADLYGSLARTVGAGVDLETAFRLSVASVRNRSARRAAARISRLVERGMSPSAAVVRSGLDPSGTDAGILRICEETGNLAGGFARAATAAAARHDAMIAAAAKTIEPLGVLLLALIVGGFVLAVYQPLLGLSGVFASDMR
jgi:general secretion pathway protein F